MLAVEWIHSSEPHQSNEEHNRPHDLHKETHLEEVEDIFFSYF